jgi:hypothetical protein
METMVITEMSCNINLVEVSRVATSIPLRALHGVIRIPEDSGGMGIATIAP